MSILSIIKVYKIQIIEGDGADELLFETNLPCSVYPFAGRATLKMAAAKGTGKEYVARNFDNVIIEFISVPLGRTENDG
jgi:hypothetical protein